MRPRQKIQDFTIIYPLFTTKFPDQFSFLDPAPNNNLYLYAPLAPATNINLKIVEDLHHFSGTWIECH